mmetsp:Transcript_47464/g.143664  ORF Transcript_47464/g.143664 Transcript_47464/m.143664 type:complete len:238 (+) Transcript_47464:1451-2164(+)
MLPHGYFSGRAFLHPSRPGILHGHGHRGRIAPSRSPVFVEKHEQPQHGQCEEDDHDPRPQSERLKDGQERRPKTLPRCSRAVLLLEHDEIDGVVARFEEGRYRRPFVRDGVRRYAQVDVPQRRRVDAIVKARFTEIPHRFVPKKGGGTRHLERKAALQRGRTYEIDYRSLPSLILREMFLGRMIRPLPSPRVGIERYLERLPLQARQSLRVGEGVHESARRVREVSSAKDGTRLVQQ